MNIFGIERGSVLIFTGAEIDREAVQELSALTDCTVFQFPENEVSVVDPEPSIGFAFGCPCVHDIDAPETAQDGFGLQAVIDDIVARDIDAHSPISLKDDFEIMANRLYAFQNDWLKTRLPHVFEAVKGAVDDQCDEYRDAGKKIDELLSGVIQATGKSFNAGGRYVEIRGVAQVSGLNIDAVKRLLKDVLKVDGFSKEPGGGVLIFGSLKAEPTVDERWSDAGLIVDQLRHVMTIDSIQPIVTVPGYIIKGRALESASWADVRETLEPYVKTILGYNMNGQELVINVLPRDEKSIPQRAADAVGVTPYSDCRPFVEQAVQWALDNDDRKYMIGDATMKRVFEPNGMVNLADLQAFLDAVEGALQPSPIAEPEPVAHEHIADLHERAIEAHARAEAHADALNSIPENFKTKSDAFEIMVSEYFEFAKIAADLSEKTGLKFDAMPMGEKVWYSRSLWHYHIKARHRMIHKQLTGG